MLGPGARRGQRAADVRERLAGLLGQVAGADEPAGAILGHLSRDEDQPAAVATTTWEYVWGVASSAGLMGSSGMGGGV